MTIGNAVGLMAVGVPRMVLGEASRGNDKDDVLVERRAKDSGQQPKKGASDKDLPASSGSDVGAALRKAFQSAVEEDVPDELLDLLRRLD